jgi:2-keto-4-pentenoate hydratase/2-oxohepta-3-ene-1,7-dioic acid hydratase in catechol pathway
LFAHQETVPFPFDEPHPEADVAIAALVGEELRSSTVKDVEKAIVGYTILVRWIAPTAEKRSGSTHARSFATSLGPLLVSKEEAGAIDALRVRVRAAGDNRDLMVTTMSDWSFSEAIAFVSRHVPLMPGDVVGGVPIPGARATLRELGLSFGTTLEVAIERLGKLASRPVRGPEPPAIRQRPPPTSEASEASATSETTDHTETDHGR